MLEREGIDASFKRLCPNVYFQPTVNIRMNYPAIVYRRTRIQNRHADNIPYKQDWGYELIYITKNPDDETVKDISLLPYCAFQTNYTVENLYHYKFLIYNM